MWLVMGFGAIVFAILNLVWTSKQKKEARRSFLFCISWYEQRGAYASPANFLAQSGQTWYILGKNEWR